MEFLSKTPVRIALAAAGTAVVATVSYVAGHHNGVQKAVAQCEQVIKEHLKTCSLLNEEPAAE